MISLLRLNKNGVDSIVAVLDHAEPQPLLCPASFAQAIWASDYLGPDLLDPSKSSPVRRASAVYHVMALLARDATVGHDLVNIDCQDVRHGLTRPKNPVHPVYRCSFPTLRSLFARFHGLLASRPWFYLFRAFRGFRGSPAFFN
jgi:hypothetical protein